MSGAALVPTWFMRIRIDDSAAPSRIIEQYWTAKLDWMSDLAWYPEKIETTEEGPRLLMKTHYGEWRPLPIVHSRPMGF